MTAPFPSILVVLHDFALGGTERVAIRLARAWTERDVAVTIFAGSDDGPLRALAGSRVEIVVTTPPIPRKRGSRRRLARAARAFVAGRQFGHVFVPGNFHWPVAAALAGSGVAVIAQVSAALDKLQRGPIRQWSFEMRMRRLLRRVEAVVTLSDRARDQADRILRRRVSTTITLPARADDVPAALSIPDTSPAVIMVAGRLVPEKGFARVIDAVAALPDGAARLVIVGDGPEIAALWQPPPMAGAQLAARRFPEARQRVPAAPDEAPVATVGG